MLGDIRHPVTNCETEPFIKRYEPPVVNVHGALGQMKALLRTESWYKISAGSSMHPNSDYYDGANLMNTEKKKPNILASGDRHKVSLMERDGA